MGASWNDCHRRMCSCHPSHNYQCDHFVQEEKRIQVFTNALYFIYFTDKSQQIHRQSGRYLGISFPTKPTWRTSISAIRDSSYGCGQVWNSLKLNYSAVSFLSPGSVQGLLLILTTLPTADSYHFYIPIVQWGKGLKDLCSGTFQGLVSTPAQVSKVQWISYSRRQ